MPYIKQDQRKKFHYGLDSLPVIDNPGELNYLVSQLIRQYIKYGQKSGYQAINDIIGALEGAKLEFYRKIVIPYENQKIKENGDL